MKRLSLLLALIFCVSIIGCNKAAGGTSDSAAKNATENTVDPSLEAADGVVTRYLAEKSERNIISAQYPVFSGEENEGINLLVRNFISNKIKNECGGNVDLSEADRGFDYSDDYSQYYVNIGYDITYRADDMISIIFSGNFDLKNAAHPTQVFWSLNIDPLTAAQVRFSDKYVADEELYTIYRENAQKALAGTVLSDVDLAEYLCSAERFVDSIMQDDSICFYYTEEGIGISSPVAHVIGDHIEAVIPYEVMEGFRNDGVPGPPDELPFAPATAEDYDYICEMAESDARFRWVKAFVEKDAVTCADFQRHPSEEYRTDFENQMDELYGWLDRIELSGYSVELITDDDDTYPKEVLRFDFEIAKSDYELFPVGSYSYDVAFDGYYAEIRWEKVSGPGVKGDVKLEPWMPSDTYLLYAGVSTLDYGNDEFWMSNTSLWLFETIYYAFKDHEDYISYERLKDAAYHIYGIEDYVPGRDYIQPATEVEGGYTLAGHDGLHSSHYINKTVCTGNTVDVYVYYYGDYMKTIIGRCRKYSFEKADTEYGYRVTAIEEIPVNL